MILLLTKNKQGVLGFVASLLILFTFMESMLGLFIYTFFYLQAMKWYQNYEYFKHRNRVLVHSSFLVVFLGILVGLAYVLCF